MLTKFFLCLLMSKTRSKIEVSDLDSFNLREVNIIMLRIDGIFAEGL